MRISNAAVLAVLLLAVSISTMAMECRDKTTHRANSQQEASPEELRGVVKTVVRLDSRPTKSLRKVYLTPEQEEEWDRLMTDQWWTTFWWITTWTEWDKEKERERRRLLCEHACHQTAIEEMQRCPEWGLLAEALCVHIVNREHQRCLSSC